MLVNIGFLGLVDIVSITPLPTGLLWICELPGCPHGIKKESAPDYDASPRVWSRHSDNDMESSGGGILQRLTDARLDQFNCPGLFVYTLVRYRSPRLPQHCSTVAVGSLIHLNPLPKQRHCPNCVHIKPGARASGSRFCSPMGRLWIRDIFSERFVKSSPYRLVAPDFAFVLRLRMSLLFGPPASAEMRRLHSKVSFNHCIVGTLMRKHCGIRFLLDSNSSRTST